VKAFSLIIPSYNIEKEHYQPVNQCLKCYQFDHNTPQCPKTSNVCSKCAIEGHTHKTCTAQFIKCMNCEGSHTAVSYACPMRKEALKNQHPSPEQPASNPTLPTQPLQSASYAQITKTLLQTPITPAPPMPNPTPSPTTQFAPISTPDTSLICAKVQACASAASHLSNGDPAKFCQLFPLILHENNLPKIRIPQSIISATTTPSLTSPSEPNTSSHQPASRSPANPQPANQSAPPSLASKSSPEPSSALPLTQDVKTTTQKHTILSFSKPTIVSCTSNPPHSPPSSQTSSLAPSPTSSHSSVSTDVTVDSDECESDTGTMPNDLPPSPSPKHTTPISKKTRSQHALNKSSHS